MLDPDIPDLKDGAKSEGGTEAREQVSDPYTPDLKVRAKLYDFISLPHQAQRCHIISIRYSFFCLVYQRNTNNMLITAKAEATTM